MQIPEAPPLCCHANTGNKLHFAIIQIPEGTPHTAVMRIPEAPPLWCHAKTRRYPTFRSCKYQKQIPLYCHANTRSYSTLLSCEYQRLLHPAVMHIPETTSILLSCNTTPQSAVMQIQEATPLCCHAIQEATPTCCHANTRSYSSLLLGKHPKLLHSAVM